MAITRAIENTNRKTTNTQIFIDAVFKKEMRAENSIVSLSKIKKIPGSLEQNTDQTLSIRLLGQKNI